LIVTEYELRANWHKTKDKVITLPQGSVITPSARDFIRSKGIEIQIEGNGVLDINKTTLSNAHQSVQRQSSNPLKDSLDPVINPKDQDPNSSGNKPEHKTHLHRGTLVPKTHPVIAYRGQLDLFQCELVEAQSFFYQEGETELVGKLEEIAAFARQLMVCEVKEEPFQWEGLLGLKPEELREHSHHPKKYFGLDHAPLSYTHGKLVAKLHHLRAKSREVELYANRAFTDELGNCCRMDLIIALNRLSSVLYILACDAQSRKQQEKQVPIGVSNRHVHLSGGDLETLFGPDYKLSQQKKLSQPGQFAAEETVMLTGPKGSFEKVRVLGPQRETTQVEISVSDCYALGIKPVIRDSGDHNGTPGLLIVGPKGKVSLESGVIVASRHIHLSTQEAEEWSLRNGARVRVKVQSQRPIVFEDVLIRVSDHYRKELHLDIDESNAALISSSDQGVLVGV